MLLGVRFATCLGQVETSGSKTVKNVVGYDIKRLMVGSGGSLGMLVDATFRTLPLPIAEETLVVALDSIDDALATALDVRVSRLLPSSIELVNDAQWTLAAKALGLAYGGGSWRLMFSLRGYQSDVEFMRGGIADIAGRHGGSVAETLDAQASAEAWRMVTEPSTLIDDRFMALKIVVPPGEMAAPLRRIESLSVETGSAAYVRASAGSGAIHVLSPGTADAFGRALVAEPACPNGFITADAPAGLAFGLVTPPAPDRISAGIKAAYDPAGILPDIPA